MRRGSEPPEDLLFPAEVDPWIFERSCFRDGYGRIAGVDEAGRGPLAGPVVAAAVILPQGCRIPHLTDSKKLSPRQRETLFPVIREQALSVGVGMSGPALIDRINILEATRRAMEQAVAALDPEPDCLLIDALRIRTPIPQQAIVKGDLLSHSISAASVIAKVTRDRLMEDYDRLYPGYHFKKHKGYGTREHRERIVSLGPCPIHRRSFRGVREQMRDPCARGPFRKP